MRLDEAQEWQAHFLLEDFRADYRTACIVWCQTDGKKSPYAILQQLFPEYDYKEPPTPWTEDDEAHFNAWFANVKQRLDNGRHER